MSREEHYQQGMELFAEDRMEEAIRELEKAVELDPGYGDALHALAMCCYHAGRLDEAIQAGLRFREVEPHNALAYTSLSMFYQAKGMIPEAEEMGARAMEAARRAQ